MNAQEKAPVPSVVMVDVTNVPTVHEVGVWAAPLKLRLTLPPAVNPAPETV